MTDALLQFAGRLHPMVLHVPIGLVVALIACEAWAFLRARPMDRPTRILLAWLIAVTSIASAASGWLLAEEGLNSGLDLTLHRWFGVGCAGIGLALACTASAGRTRIYTASIIALAALLVPTGHFGSAMTHGSGFLTEPFARQTQQTTSISAQPSSSTVFESEVEPIFSTYCLACHNAERSKGGLALDDRQAIANHAQEIIHRVELPIDDDDHMPPASKLQPSPDQIDALRRWVSSGASFESASRATHTGQAGLDHSIEPTPKPSRESIAALRQALVHVEVIDPQQGSLWVDCTAATHLSGQALVNLLDPVAPAIVDLNLSRLEHADHVIRELGARLSGVESLELASTRITSTAADAIASSSSLVKVNLAGAQLTPEAAMALTSIESLEHVNLWNTGLSSSVVAAITEQRPRLEISIGDDLFANAIETEPEFVLGTTAANALRPSNDRCPITGQPINPKFTIVHEGRVIGFCCENCVQEFWNAPEEFDD